MKVVAVAYLVSLLAVVVALAFVGERWWITTLALYVPRLGFALPLPFIVLLLLAFRLRRYLWTQLAALLVVLFPLMGFTLPSFASKREGEPTLRVLSFNVNTGYSGPEAVAQKIDAYSPDVVVMQEALIPQPFVELMKARYPHVENAGQFVLASRYPVLSTHYVGHLPYYGRTRSPRFVQHRLQTPLGPVALYNVHPISPRGVLKVNRLRGAFHLLRTGQLLAGDPEFDVKHNTGLRTLQVETIAKLAAAERDPVLIAGDTNLPGLSRVLKNFSAYEDGFSAAGRGFGYTFPSNRAWLRLDRMFASSALRFTSFQVGCEGVSDHLCVVAELQRK